MILPKPTCFVVLTMVGWVDLESVHMRGQIRSHFWILGKFRHSKSKFYKILDEIAHFFGLERVWDLDLSGHELFMQPRLILSTEMAD